MEEEDNFVTRETVSPFSITLPNSPGQPACTPRSRTTTTQPPHFQPISASVSTALSSSAPSILSPAPLLNFMKRIKIAEAILQIQDLQVGFNFIYLLTSHLTLIPLLFRMFNISSSVIQSFGPSSGKLADSRFGLSTLMQ